MATCTRPGSTCTRHPGASCATIAAGASYAGSQWRNAYNVARVSFGPKREVKFRLPAYAKGERCFVNDVETYAQAEDGTWTWELAGAVRPAQRNRTAKPRAEADARPYLEELREQTRWLDIRGVLAKEAARVELERVYTQLRVTAPAAESEAAPPRKARPEKAAADDLRELLPRHADLVLVGDPGAGKTTFLRFVALNLARALLGDERERSLGWCADWWANRYAAGTRPTGAVRRTALPAWCAAAGSAAIRGPAVLRTATTTLRGSSSASTMSGFGVWFWAGGQDD